MKELLRQNKGFTLVELLVAISIIALLTAVVMPNFMGAREKGKDAQKRADLSSMKNALRLYYNDNQAYPDTKATWDANLPTYAPAMQGVGYTWYYASDATRESFQLCTYLDAPTNNEAVTSQNKCNFMPGGLFCGLTSDNTLYVVCAN